VIRIFGGRFILQKFKILAKIVWKFFALQNWRI